LTAAKATTGVNSKDPAIVKHIIPRHCMDISPFPSRSHSVDNHDGQEN
jgi:hypothetical protein